jgi:hypothetical protein
VTFRGVELADQSIVLDPVPPPSIEPVTLAPSAKTNVPPSAERLTDCAPLMLKVSPVPPWSCSNPAKVRSLPLC